MVIAKQTDKGIYMCFQEFARESARPDLSFGNGTDLMSLDVVAVNRSAKQRKRSFYTAV